MNLIENMSEECTIMNRAQVDDGEGGVVTTWTEGATIKAAIVNDTSITARRAEQEGVTSTYTITTSKDVLLEYHEVIKRNSDGRILRVTSDPADKASPAVSNLNMRQVTAEKWELTQ